MMLEFYKEKSFQNTQRGKYPEDWGIRRFKEILSLEYGKGLPERERIQGKYPVVGSNGVIGHHNKALIEGPGIIVGRKGTMGAVTWIDSDFWPIDTTYYVQLKVGNIFLKWLLYELIHMDLPRLSLADVVPGLKRELVYSMVLPIPPSEEQRRIVEVLSCADDAIQKVDEVIEKTERLKNGLMQKLFTQGVGHKEFRETKVGKIPETWKVVGLGDVITYEKGRKPKKIFDQEVPNSLPYLSAEALRTGEFNNWAKQNGEIVKVNKGDLVLIWDGFYCGDIFTGGDGILSSTMIKIKMTMTSLDRLFLFYFLKTRCRELNVKHVGMYLKHVSKRVFRSLKVPLPSLSEQQKIAGILSTVDQKLELDMKRKKKLLRIKKGLMNDLLSGKIRVKVD